MLPTPRNSALPDEVVRFGYRFEGWYANENCTGPEVTKIGATETGNKTYYAKWYQYQIIHTCTSVCPVCGGCEDADCTDSACEDKCILPHGFTDVAEGKWYSEAVEYVYHRGMMDGVGGGKFDLNGTTTRAMIVTILWRLEGEPAVSYDMPFEDVSSGLWYSEAVRWAASEGIVEGVSASEFAPTAPITREQFAAILWRYAESKGYDLSASAALDKFADALSVSEYAVPAMQWAVAEGIIQGDGMGLSPKAGATRAQAAALLMRFCEDVIK